MWGFLLFRKGVRQLIELSNVNKSFGHGRQAILVVDDVSMSIGKGEIFGIIGHSGAGKSTLLRCINLLEKPTSGSVKVADTELTKLGTGDLQKARRRIGMIFQHFNLLSTASVRDNVAFPLRLSKLSRTEIRKRVDELLDLVGLAAHADKYPVQLSGGQKQRVGIARALANRPDVLLCDEATSALDPPTTASILELLLDINRKMNITVLLVTHEMQVVRSICDRVAVMDKGRLVESGPVIDVLLKPQHEATRQLLQETEEFRDYAPPVSRRGGTRIRILYVGDSAYEPALYEACRGTSVSFAILQGTVSRVKDIPYGRMTVELKGPPEEIRTVIDGLRQRAWEVEAEDVV
jgi:D-methionine transport system ATP-binding protein